LAGLISSTWCTSSTRYYAWTPNVELVYHFESQILSAIPEINSDQFSGLGLSADARVQAFSDYSLRIKFENATFVTVNGQVDLSERGGLLDLKGELQDGVLRSEIPSRLKLHLEKSFVVHLKKGLVESFYVEATEPNSITNIKRSFLSQIQLDISGHRRSDFDNVQPSDDNNDNNDDYNDQNNSNETISYFTTREESLHGDCQTSYSVHPISNDIQLEKDWRRVKQENGTIPNDICQGKKFYKIMKNKNLDDCHKRPFYQKFVGIESQCDASQSSCTDQFNVNRKICLVSVL